MSQGAPLQIETLVGTHRGSPSQGKTPDSAATALQSTNKIA
jgi:hypothetical protein